MVVSLDSLANEFIERNPDLKLAQMKFKLSLADYKDDSELNTELLNIITRDYMAPWYEIVCKDLKWKLNTTLLSEMKAKNDDELSKIDEEITVAEKFSTEVDVRDAYLKKAQFLSRMGDEKKALETYEQAFEKSVPITHRIEILFHCIRIGLFFMNHKVYWFTIFNKNSCCNHIFFQYLLYEKQ